MSPRDIMLVLSINGLFWADKQKIYTFNGHSCVLLPFGDALNFLNYLFYELVFPFGPKYNCPCLSLGHKTGVLITVPSLFRRFNKMWRLHLVIFIFCRYKTWYKTCSKSAEFHTIIFNKEYWWMHREFFGTLFGPQPFNFTPEGLWNVS